MFANALALLLAVPLIVQLVFAQSPTCTRTYTVQQGDTCDGISAAQNVSTYQLAVVNDGVIDPQCDNLNPTTSICLGWAGEDCTNTYVVQPNDDCDLVSSNYGINVTTLYYNNPQLNAECSNLYIGEVVCISSSVQVPPVPSSGTIPASVIPPTATPAPSDLPWCD